MITKKMVQKLAKDQSSHLKNIRHHLHAHPELSFQEYQTAIFIEKQLQLIGITNYERMVDTGIVAYIEGDLKTENKEQNTIALRADIDALPIEEENQVEYKSKNKGVMHACGHDVHTTCLLGAAKIITQLKPYFSGRVKLLFQPAEEKTPGGAKAMIKAGVLKNPAVKTIIGQHVTPFLPVGTVGFREGKYMASADEIYLHIKGKGGHGAMPEFCIDPVVITSQLIITLQQIVSRGDPKIPTILSFGKVIAQGATNIIPDSVYVEGTLRTLDEEWRKKVHKKLKDTIFYLVKGMGAQVEIEIKKGYPHLYNNIPLTQKMRGYAVEYMGSDKVVDLDIRMTAEDFSYYSKQVPACFYRLGTRNISQNTTSNVHTSTFDIDEGALEIGSGLMAWLAMQQLVNRLQKNKTSEKG